MAATDDILGALRHLSVAEWAWWIATVVLWPVWLLLLLGVQLAVYVGAMAATAPTLTALAIAVLAALVLCATGSWFLGGTTTVNGAPRGLWRVPAVYGAVALLGIVGVDVFQWTQGLPGPLPWQTPTTIGFVLLATVGIIPALGAVAFRVGVRSAGPQIAVAPGGAQVGAPPR